MQNSSLSSELERLELSPPVSPKPLRKPFSSTSKSLQNHCQTITKNSDKYIKIGLCKPIQLKIGDVYDVKISHVKDGPAEFSVQLLQSLPYLNRMMDKINSRSHKLLQEPPITGMVCLGCQTYPEKRFYRVVLRSFNNTSSKVYYIDYGYHGTLQFHNIYQIPDEFITENAFSIKFTLNRIRNWNITQDIKAYFQCLIDNKDLKIKICGGPLSPIVQYCELYLKGQNIENMLTNAFPDACNHRTESNFSPKLPSCSHKYDFNQVNSLLSKIFSSLYITLGNLKNCIMVYYSDPLNFFLQLCPENKKLDLLMDEISIIYAKNDEVLPVSHIQPGLPCVAKYSKDLGWYRAVVISVNSLQATVYFIDYGNVEKIDFINIKKINSQFLTLPAQAVRCRLFGLDDASWTQDESNLLFNRLDDKNLEVEFVSKKNDVYYIDIKNAFSIITPTSKISESENSSECESDDLSEYSSRDEDWEEYEADPESDKVTVTCYINPKNFCYHLDGQQSVPGHAI